MAGALVTLIVLLRKLDLLRWHEKVTIWEPTTRLFRSMGRDPYVPGKSSTAVATGPPVGSASSTTPTPIRFERTRSSPSVN